MNPGRTPGVTCPPFEVTRSTADWARELDCTPAQAQRAIDNLVARGLIVVVDPLSGDART